MSNTPIGGPAQRPSYEVSSEADFREYLRSVFNYMAGGLALTGAISFGAAATGVIEQLVQVPFLFLIIALAPVGVVWMLASRVNSMSLTAVQATYWAYSALVGLSLGVIFLRYTGESIFRVFFITAGTFGAMSLYGYTTKADLSRWGSFLFMGLIGIIIASVVNLFLHSSMIQFVVSAAGVLIFTGLTAYDVNKIKQIAANTTEFDEVAKKGAIMGALELYLDFINLFLMLLRLLGDRR